MMTNLPDIYDRRFFEEWGIKNSPYITSAKIITNIIFSIFNPQTLVDVGCGCGVYSRLFSEKGVRVTSIDGVIPPPDLSYPLPIQIRDLTVPFTNSWGHFDLSLCLEVAEHIPENLSQIFLSNLTQLSNTLILSAAPPFQGGHHHVNEQPKRYWVQKLSEFNFKYNRKKTGIIQETFKKIKCPFMWMGEHISVYEKIINPSHPPRELPFGIIYPK